MIDWLTIRIDISELSEATRAALDGTSNRLQKISPDGEIIWDTASFESLRSDMNGLAWSYGTCLTLAGSPASVVYPNNVFGTSNLGQAFIEMVNFFMIHTGVTLPCDITKWSCSRIDYTVNYDLGGQHAVAQALHYLRHAHTRGNNVERRHTTVYWNKTSSIRSGKAYNKYEHAKHYTKKNKAHYTPEQLQLTRNLLRLELKLGRHWIREQVKPWYKMTENDLHEQHINFFGNITTDIEVPTMDTLLDRLLDTAPTNGQAHAAHRYFCTIRSLGHEMARSTVTKSSHYRHLANLRKAGLTNADFVAGEIHQMRPRLITMRPVSDWSEISRAA